MNKVTKVQLCTICYDYDDACGHNLPQTGYKCNLCLFVHSLNREAQSCCMDMVSKDVVGTEHLQPASKRVAKPSEYYPTEAVKRAKGR